MAVTLEELAARIDRVERELRRIEAKSDDPKIPSGDHSPLPALRWMTSAERQAMSETFKEIAAEMGGNDIEPIGAEANRRRIRERWQFEGIEEGNWFSQSIREMREE